MESVEKCVTSISYMGLSIVSNNVHVKDTKTNNFFIENHICLLKKYLI